MATEPGDVKTERFDVAEFFRTPSERRQLMASARERGSDRRWSREVWKSNAKIGVSLRASRLKRFHQA